MCMHFQETAPSRRKSDRTFSIQKGVLLSMPSNYNFYERSLMWENIHLMGLPMCLWNDKLDGY